jgi:hypothetical protein
MELGKPVEIVLRRAGRWGGGIEGGMNLMEVYCTQVWKYQNKTHLYN